MFDSLRFCLPIAAAGILLPICVHAQFQTPSAEELQMSSYAKAPGAAAVYLYREELFEDQKHTEIYYDRIKVLTEKGKQLATVRIPYEHGQFFLHSVEARTVHADGTVVPLDVKPNDLIDFKTKGLQLNAIVFTLPSVEVGSILEYRIKFNYDVEDIMPATWDIQDKYPIKQAHFVFHPSGYNGIGIPHYSSSLPEDRNQIQEKKGQFLLDMSDIPAVPDEDWMPPLNTIKWRVRFYYGGSDDPSLFWKFHSESWSESVNSFVQTTPGLTKIASEITPASDPDAQKAVKLYAAVMKLENTDFTRQESDRERKEKNLKQIKVAEDIWKQQSGNGNLIALLYVALARASGLKAYAMWVVNRDRAIFDPGYRSTYQLDDYVVIVMLNGKEVFLDPGEKFCAFGGLHWKHMLATGIRQGEQGTSVARTPAGGYKGSSVQRIADVTVAPDGTITGTVRFVMNGPESLRWRQVAVQNDEAEVKKQFNEALTEILPDGVHADFNHFLGLEDYNSVLMATATIHGDIGTAAGKRFLLPGQFFASHAKHPFVAEETRSTPIDVQHAQLVEDDVTYNLPAGYTVESAPQAARIDWPDHGYLKINSKADGSSVNITREMAGNYILLGASEYPKLRGFYQQIAAADQQQLVLVRAQQAKAQ